MLKRLEGFHNRVARRLANRMPRRHNGEWVYPPIASVLDDCGMCTIEEYILRRRETVGRWVSTRPVFELCQAAERQTGSPQVLKWWDQTLVRS